MSFLTGIWGKVAAVGGAILAVLFIVWRVFAKGESVGQAKQERKQQKQADEARQRIDAVKPEDTDAIADRLDRREF